METDTAQPQPSPSERDLKARLLNGLISGAAYGFLTAAVIALTYILLDRIGNNDDSGFQFPAGLVFIFLLMFCAPIGMIGGAVVGFLTAWFNTARPWLVGALGAFILVTVSLISTWNLIKPHTEPLSLSLPLGGPKAGFWLPIYVFALLGGTLIGRSLMRRTDS
jgi:hypothetical protein